MNIWISALIVLLELMGIPFLLGLLWNIREENAGISKIYTDGYMTMLALFWAMACPLVYTKGRLTVLARLWGIASAVIVIVCLAAFFFCRKRLAEKLCAVRKSHRAHPAEKGAWVGLGILAAVLLLGSAVFAMPSAEDDVPETVGTAIVTDSMYEYDPYTQLLSGSQADKVFSPLEMLYAVTALLCGMDSTVMIHLLLPFPLILLYYAVGGELSGVFREKREARTLFFAFWIIGGTISYGASRLLSFGIYTSPWNGSTLVTACILPLVMKQCFSLHRLSAGQKKAGVKAAVLLLLSVAAAQLAVPKGALLAILMIISCACVTGFLWIIGRMERKNG